MLKTMIIIPLQIKNLFDLANMETITEKKEFNTAAVHRVESLKRAIITGDYYSQIKSILLSAPNKKQIVTDMQTYTGWTDFIKKHQLDYKTIEQYIFMYKHQQEFTEMKLLSTAQEDIDSGASGHRKIAACEAVKWYLSLLQQDPSLRGKVTAADYQAHKSQLASVGKQVLTQPNFIKVKYEEYQLILKELEELRAEVAQYRVTVK